MAKIIRYFLMLFLFLVFKSQSAFSQETTHPDTVKIGCYIISLHDFDSHDEEYTARFWLWMVYDSPRISFKDDIEIPNAKEISVDEFIEDSTGGKKWIQMKLKCTMKGHFEMDDFPFDNQHLDIIVENSKYDTRSMVFVPDTVGKFFDPELAIDGWDITSFNLVSGISNYATGFGDTSLKNPKSQYSNFVVNIGIAREGWGLFLKLFLGMYVAFAIAYVSFFIDPEQVDPRFGLPVGGLFAAVGNKYIIDSYLPDDATLTILDSLHGITFLMIFFIIAFSAYSLRLDSSGDNLKSKRTDKIVAWSMLVIYILVNVFSVIWATWGHK